jgi:hypothetical protein
LSGSDLTTLVLATRSTLHGRSRRGASWTKALRDAAWDAHRAAQAARDTSQQAAHDAARAAGHAAGAAFLHPLARAHQVKHILGSAAHTARAIEVDAADHAAGADSIERAVSSAPLAVTDVLRRYPTAPTGGGRVGELVRLLDAALRWASAAHLHQRPPCSTASVSHGCLNLNHDNAAWFYNFSVPGDVVEVRNTGGKPLQLWQNGD